MSKPLRRGLAGRDKHDTITQVGVLGYSRASDVGFFRKSGENRHFAKAIDVAVLCARHYYWNCQSEPAQRVRLKFKDNETTEALMTNDLTQNVAEGYTVIPPDTRANTQRIFVPRTALDSLTVLAVIGGPAGRRKKAAAVPAGQEELFQE